MSLRRQDEGGAKLPIQVGIEAKFTGMELLE
jgi:hypothetical protein